MSSDRKKTTGLNESSEASPLRGGWVGAVDINCDMGEGIGNDDLIMPFISSANIACGYHAGDERTIRETIQSAQKHGVKVGAHVSFFDKENFGRKEIHLSPGEVYDLVFQQLTIIKKIADDLQAKLEHVKPHGALYNMSAKDPGLAKTIAGAIKDFDKSLIVFGLCDSHSIYEAAMLGLQTASEVFADRTYQDDGSLTPRNKPGALISDAGKVVQQVLQMIKVGTVTTISGNTLPIIAETVCIHGDGEHAIEFARSLHETLKKG